jgi:hypothetical protein
MCCRFAVWIDDFEEEDTIGCGSHGVADFEDCTLEPAVRKHPRRQHEDADEVPTEPWGDIKIVISKLNNTILIEKLLIVINIKP